MGDFSKDVAVRRTPDDRKRRKGGLIFLFVSLSLAQRIAVVCLGFFVTTVTVSAIVWPEARKNTDFKVLGSQANSAELEAPMPAWGSCGTSGIVDGQFQAETPVQPVPQDICETRCTRWLGKVEAGNARCFWRGSVFRELKGEPAQTCQASYVRSGKEKEQRWESSKQSCLTRCESAFAAAAPDAAICTWGSESLFTRGPPRRGSGGSVADGKKPAGDGPYAFMSAGDDREPASGGGAKTFSSAPAFSEPEPPLPPPAPPLPRPIATPVPPPKGKSDPQTKLLEAAFSGDVTSAKQALAAGALVNGTTPESLGHSALQLALLERDRGMLQFLIDSCADVNVTDEEGRSPLIYAAKHRLNVEFAKALVKAGADLKAVDSNGNNALAVARQRGDEELIDYLEQVAKSDQIRSAPRSGCSQN